MNVPIIFYAAQESSDTQLFRVATAHCRTTRDKIVRPDGSTAQEALFDLQTGSFSPSRHPSRHPPRKHLGPRSGLVAIWILQSRRPHRQLRVFRSGGAQRKILARTFAGRPGSLLGFRGRSLAAASAGCAKKIPPPEPLSPAACSIWPSTPKCHNGPSLIAKQHWPCSTPYAIRNTWPSKPPVGKAF